MTDKDIEQKLKAAIERTAPDGLDRLLSAVDDRKGAAIMENTSRKKRSRWIGAIAAVLAVALLGGLGGYYYGQNYAVATTVSLDVNPSIQLEVNRSEKILTCTGLNDEGREILASMNGGADLEGSKLNVAVNAIVGAIVRAGYLDSLSSAILISVEDSNAARGERLQAQLVAEVDGVLQTAANSAGVLSQYLTVDAGLNQQAQQNNISSGKAVLVNQVLALNASLDFEKLAALSVEELRDLIKIGAPGMPIGKTEAARIAEEYAGGLAPDSVAPEVDPELDDPTPHYEVELTWGSHINHYEYTVDAFTGAILSGEANITGRTPAITADEAFDAAANYFTENHALRGNFLNIKNQYDPEDGCFEVECRCQGWEFDYDVNGQTGEILREKTDYRDTPPTIPDTTPDSTVPDTPPKDTTSPDTTPADTAPKDTTPPDTTPRDTTPAQPSDIGAEAAKAAALSRAGIADAASVTWIRCQREYDDGRLEYEIEFTVGATEYEITVLAADGTVLKYETEKAHTAPSTPSQSGDVGADAAKAAALQHAGLSQSQVTRLKCERDFDDGRIEYEVSFRYNGFEYEYKIDASNGSILEHERDWDD